MGITLGKGDGTPPFSQCTLQIERMLKGEETTTVLIAMAPFVVVGKNWYRWKSPMYHGGVKEIWFLSKNPKTVPKKVINYIRNIGDYYFIYKRQNPDDQLINTILGNKK